MEELIPTTKKIMKEDNNSALLEDLSPTTINSGSDEENQWSKELSPMANEEYLSSFV